MTVIQSKDVIFPGISIVSNERIEKKRPPVTNSYIISSAVHGLPIDRPTRSAALYVAHIIIQELTLCTMVRTML